MLRRSLQNLRRGKRRPKGSDFESRWRHEPPSLKPQQGGQQMFESLLLQKANAQAKESITQSLNRYTKTTEHLRSYGAANPSLATSTEEKQVSDNQFEVLRHLHLPGVEAEAQRPETFDLDRKLDAWTDKRKFNAVEWYMENKDELPQDARRSQDESGISAAAEQLEAKALPEETATPDIANISVFEEKFGCSMLKSWRSKTNFQAGDIDFQNNLDLWGEMPKYTNDMYFLYLIIRRRNTYAVVFDINGKCIHAPLSAGKVGLKNSDKGWRAEGSANTGHVVTSKYLDIIYPKLCLLEESQSRYQTGVQKGRRPIQVVLRVMGWYNGRQGALRALNDRKDKYQVCYFEDITPVPRNGPRMPKLKRR